MLIGRLVVRLDCYLPERADEDWARLRHLGAHRARLVSEVVSCHQQIADLLGCCWPAALSVAARPLESASWLACMSVVVDAGADLAALDQGGIEGFTAAARTHLPHFGTKRVCHRIVRAFFAALRDPGGVAAQRPGALERVGLVLADWRAAQVRLSDVESRMVGVLDAMGLTALVTSIPGVSTVGAAVILAETGDPSRFASARSVVKHAGLNPVENTSATFRGATRISHRGRPGLRVAAWRAVWAALQHNQVLADRYTHLTTRARDQLTAGQARAACAATLLRWLYAIITHRQAYDATIASGQARATSRSEALAA